MSQGITPALSEAKWEAARSASPFEMRVAESGQQVLARVDGPLDVQHAPDFVNQLEPLCGAGRRVIVDLRNADYVDSAGVRALLHLQGLLRGSSGEVLLVASPESRAVRTLKLLRLDGQFRMFERASEAWGGGQPPLS